LASVCCGDLGDLLTRLIRARERLRHQRDVICGGESRRCGYVVEFLTARQSLGDTRLGRESP
jgi:hypothetical protein